MEIIFFENKLINIFLTYTRAQHLEIYIFFYFDYVFGKLREQSYANFHHLAGEINFFLKYTILLINKYTTIIKFSSLRCREENANKRDASTRKLKITTIQHSWTLFQWRKNVLSFDMTLVVMCKVELLWSFEVQVGVGRWEVRASTCTLKIENLKTLCTVPCVAKGNYICRYDRIYNF